MNQEQLNKIPTFPQRKDSVSDQLSDLVTVANKLGMFDAANAINQIYEKLPKLKYACYVEGEEFPDCVIDNGRHYDCIYQEWLDLLQNYSKNRTGTLVILAQKR